MRFKQRERESRAAIEVEMVEPSFSQLVILRANTKVSIQKTTQTDLPISEALTVT